MTRRQERRLRRIVHQLRVEDLRQQTIGNLRHMVEICANEQRRERYRECLRILEEMS